MEPKDNIIWPSFKRQFNTAVSGVIPCARQFLIWIATSRNSLSVSRSVRNAGKNRFTNVQYRRNLKSAEEEQMH